VSESRTMHDSDHPSPVWQQDGSALYQHDVSVTPWPIPDHSVQAIITSPPYFALRVYEGVEPALWGGDSDCSHDFQEVWTTNQNTGGGVTHKQKTNAGSYQRAGGALPEKVEGPRGYSSEVCRRCGACRGTLGNESAADCLAWARGEEPCGQCYICHIRTIFREIRRVLRPDGVVWWNIGDSFSGSGGSGGDYNAGGLREGQPRCAGAKTTLAPKNLCGIPYRTALAIQADGWYWRSICGWIKRNSMPQSVHDRPTTSHEEFLLFTLSPTYYLDIDAWRIPSARPDCRRVESGAKWADGNINKSDDGIWAGSHPNGRNRRTSDWMFDSLDDQIEHTEQELIRLRKLRADGGMVTDEDGDPLAVICNTQGTKEQHYASFNGALIRPMILASAPPYTCRCGAPYRRVVVEGEPDREWQRISGGNAAGEYHGHSVKPDSPRVQNPSDLKRRILAGMKKRMTTEWKPSCSCEPGDPVAPIVLDPFTGTGTTGLEALRAGRRFIGLEASEHSCNIAIGRLKKATAQVLLPGMALAAESPISEQPALFDDLMAETAT
jgi:DNA modification methylase